MSAAPRIVFIYQIVKFVSNHKSKGMAVKEMRYENGRLSGLFIPIEDIEELKGDSQFLSDLDEILFKQQESE